MRLSFQGTAATVEVPDDQLLRLALSAAADRWPHRQTTSAQEPVSVVTVVGDDDFLLEAPHQEPVRDDALCVACAMMIDVVQALLAERPEMLSFHCAAIEIGGSLLLIPSRGRAGKSTLVARLAADGRRIWCDDILPVTPDDRRGLALGIAPRLRLPLPDHASPAFAAFVRRHLSIADGEYGYLRLAAGGLADHGETAPLGRILILDRRPGAKAELGRARRTDALRALIGQNQVMRDTSGKLLERLHAMMDRLPAYVLRYDDLDAAADTIAAAFDRPTDPTALPVFEFPFRDSASDEDPSTANVPPRGSGSGASAGIDPTRCRRRAGGIALRDVEGDLFLAGADGAALFHLNAMGAAVWSLLEQPVSVEGAVEMFRVAFPDIPPRQIRTDISGLFDALDRARLIVDADPST